MEFSIFQNNVAVSLSKVVVSNIFNVTLVIGGSAFLYPLVVKSETIKKEIPFTLLASVALLVLVSGMALQGLNENLLTRSDRIIF
ncbi:cation:H+ antiporter [Salimicrobium flavidum]|uniref:Cation:H+ antiporter n=1 Tax=Salimicrobium flavidum TaxID=570947 RepID=A0A1N7JJY8_9BACI|nr:hypothetical protein [Salimicrobium flavidum]SIS49639.1 cation:H+ antiporter [Salimicrobium flavidum]